MSEANELLRRALEAWGSKEEPYFERLHHVFEDIRTYLDNQETANHSAMQSDRGDWAKTKKVIPDEQP